MAGRPAEAATQLPPCSVQRWEHGQQVESQPEEERRRREQGWFWQSRGSSTAASQLNSGPTDLSSAPPASRTEYVSPAAEPATRAAAL